MYKNNGSHYSANAATAAAKTTEAADAGFIQVTFNIAYVVVASTAATMVIMKPNIFEINN